MSPHECSGCRRAQPTRRFVLAAIACAAALPIAAPTLVAAADTRTQTEDERFMRMALAEARLGDFPFGAVIVHDGRVLERGRNLGRTTRDPTAHGEMVAIRRVVAAHGGARLRGTTLYTTGEPCAMCMGAILWSRVGRLVFAASVKELATKIDQIMASSEEIAATARFAPIAITGGVLAHEAMALFK
jgi:tRNA(Arg) A34 adenosine deaminase TadA